MSSRTKKKKNVVYIFCTYNLGLLNNVSGVLWHNASTQLSECQCSRDQLFHRDVLPSETRRSGQGGRAGCFWKISCWRLLHCQSYYESVGVGFIIYKYGSGILESFRPFVFSPAHESSHVHSISPEPPNHLLPNLVWWCIITRRCVMGKNWFIIFSVKVTARAYLIKIWLFLLYLLNCWSVCNQTWFDSTAS